MEQSWLYFTQLQLNGLKLTTYKIAEVILPSTSSCLRKEDRQTVVLYAQLSLEQNKGRQVLLLPHPNPKQPQVKMAQVG
jgi:hypothetical protein